MKLKNYEWKTGDGIFKEDFTEEQLEFLKENLTHPNGWYSTREKAFSGDFECIACFMKRNSYHVLGSANKLYISKRLSPEDLFEEEELTDYEPTKIYQLNNTALSYGGAWTDALGSDWHYGEEASYNKILINGELYHKTHFNIATHYDEGEAELSCENIELQSGAYFDLGEHTEDQIRHIAKYFKFYDLEDLLADNWDVVYMHSKGALVGDYRENFYEDNKIHYNDLFY